MKKDLEFSEIIADIIRSDKFLSLKNEAHHGISRLDHSINVAKVTYMFSKRFNMENYREITRAALLHDLFNDEELKGKISLTNHPNKAAENAKKEFNISDLEYSMIESHMFPLTFKIPSNKESWLLVSTDKLVAIYEMFRYKLPQYAGTYYLFLLFNLKVR